MLARNIKIGTVIDGRPVVKVSSGHALFTVKRSRYTAAARFVWFDGAQRPVPYEASLPVPGRVTGYAESLPAGGVESQNVKTPPKVRASDGRWRGESVHGMRTRDHDFIAGTNMFDVGRINGVVGASRGGKGSINQTGRSF